jgi:hypothetical protein
MGKDKVQETMANYALPQIGYGSSMVVTTCSLPELVATIATCISENFWKVITCTPTSLLISWSYV